MASSETVAKCVFGGIKLPPNKPLWAAIGGMTALQTVVSLLPGARRLLGTTPLALVDLVIIAAGVLGPLIINEASKPSLPKKVKRQIKAKSIASTPVVVKNIKQEQAA